MQYAGLNQQGMHMFIRAGIVKSLLMVMIVMQFVACGGDGASGSGNSMVSHSAAASNASTYSSSGQSSASATGSLSLNWVAPVARADGTPLSLADIEGYHIYYGDKAGSYPYRIKIADGTTQQITLIDLAIGTYYIVMTTYDVDGRESDYSAMVKKSAS